MGKLSAVACAGSVAALLTTGTTAAAQTTSAGTEHFGPFASTTVDGGSCGHPWATDTVNRYFTVTDNGDGTFRVTEEFRDGTFVTLGGASPGACETTEHHGTVVAPGVSGDFRGFLSGTVSGGTYNASGCLAAPATCARTSGFVRAVFGATATYEVATFNFEYDSSDPALLYHHWQDKSTGLPIGEQFIGDIANQ